jgi:hypothetical protein
VRLCHRAVSLLLCTSACGGAAPQGVGSSRSNERPQTATRTPTSASSAPYALEKLRAQLAVIPSPSSPLSFVSLGHAGGRFRASVASNTLGTSHFTDASGTFPAGALFLMSHVENASDAATGPSLVMEKKAAGFDPAHGDWSYAVVDPKGALLREGALEPCWRCHSDAPHDYVFRLPSAAE